MFPCSLENKMSNTRIRFGLSVGQVKNFMDGKEVYYEGVHYECFGLVTIDTELDDIEILKSDVSNPTLRRRTTAKGEA